MEKQTSLSDPCRFRTTHWKTAPLSLPILSHHKAVQPSATTGQKYIVLRETFGHKHRNVCSVIFTGKVGLLRGLGLPLEPQWVVYVEMIRIYR